MRMNPTDQTIGTGLRTLPWRLLLLLGLLAVCLVLTSPSRAGAVGPVGNAPDTGSGVGRQASLELDAGGNPVVSYIGGGDLKLLHCDDPDCAGEGESIAVAAPDGDFPDSTSLALDGSGNPVVAHQMLGCCIVELMVTHCNDANCSGGDESTVPTDNTGGFICCVSLALDASGDPVVAYQVKDGGFRLTVLHCGDPNCTTGNSIEIPDTTATGFYASLVLDTSGNPVISYINFSDFMAGPGLKLVHCNDPDCSGRNESVVVVDPGEDFEYTSLRLDSSGNPVIAYYDTFSDNLKIAHCNDPNCAGADESIQAPDTDGNVGAYPSLALDAAGNPVVSYCIFPSSNSNTCDDLKVMHCNDANCAGSNEIIRTPDRFGNSGAYTSLELDAAGNPVISYCQGTAGTTGQCDALKILHCTDANCAAQPVGGVAELLPVATSAFEAAGSRGPSTVVVIGVVALVAAAFLTVGAAVWQAKRR